MPVEYSWVPMAAVAVSLLILGFLIWEIIGVWWMARYDPDGLARSSQLEPMWNRVRISQLLYPRREIAWVLYQYPYREWQTVICYLAYGYAFRRCYGGDGEEPAYGPRVEMPLCLQEWTQYERAYVDLGYRPLSDEVFERWVMMGVGLRKWRQMARPVRAKGTELRLFAPEWLEDPYVQRWKG